MEVIDMKKNARRMVSCLLTAVLAATSVLTPLNFSDTPVAQARVDTSVTVHDPSVAVSKEGKYYVFGTHQAAASSTDLVNWSQLKTPGKVLGNVATNLSEPFKWAGGGNDADSKDYSIWAPDVFWNPHYDNGTGKAKGAYMMYFCTTSTAFRSVIAYGVSQNIEGPYTYKKSLIYSGFTKKSSYDGGRVDTVYTNTNIDELIKEKKIKGLNNNWFNGDTGYNTDYAPNAIDPTVFEDKNGKYWMTYGSWSGGIFIHEIDPATGDITNRKQTGTSLSGNRITDEYFGTRIAGGFRKSGEGPYILYDKDSDYYYLYVSYEFLDSNSGYNMRLFRSKNPDGPYTDAAGRQAALANAESDHSNVGIKVMGNYEMPYIWTPYKSPGHNSALIDEKTGKRYLLYHTRFEGSGELHQLRVHQQFLNEKGWPVTAVYENTGETISKTGYSNAEIVGEYAYLNHGISSDGTNVRRYQNIILNSNGKITGDVTGTWKAKAGTYYADFVVGGVTYSGVFFKQSKETNNEQILTFTAIGTNNQTIFGARKTPGLSASKTTIYTGGNKDKTAQMKLIGMTGSSYTVSYKSSKPSVASVNSKGKVTAKKKGSAKITATLKIGNTTKTLTKTIKVKKAYLKFSKKKTSLKRKKSYKYKVKAYGIKASSVRFKSSKSSVLKINKKSGKAVAKKKGKATITAYYKKAKVKVKVKVK